jgi:hypothetical protein
MSEVLVLSPVGRKEPSLNLSVPGMSILQLLPNPTRHILCLNPFEFGLTQRIVQDLTLTAEERSHPPLPHLVVLTIKVWRNRTPFLVCHLWILDRLES